MYASQAGISRRNFIAGAAVTALGAAALGVTGCGSGSAASSAQGTAVEAYTGSGMGKHGELTVQVLMDDKTVTDITVTSSRELPGLGDVAMSKLGELIIDNQTLNLDAVTGATLSSSAFLGAVGDALTQAGEDSDVWSSRNHVTTAAASDIPSQADVIVVGGGGAGMAAAITAANAGKSVVLLEKMGVVGGDTALSGGEMAVPNNWIQQQEGISDSVALLEADMLTGGDNVGDPALVSIIANGTYDSSQWLTFEGGVSWEPDLLHFGGHSVKRSIIPTNHTGSSMTTKLHTRCEKLKVTYLDDMKVTDLVVSGGVVTGVKATSMLDGSEYSFAAGAVVLATGGFGSNVDMRVKYNPDMDGSILSTDSVGATGDGITMAEAIGANLIDMQYIQTYPTCDPATGALLYVADVRLEDAEIMINKEGNRFVQELDRRDVISAAIKKQTDGMGYMIFNQADADRTDLLNMHSDEYENLLSRGIIVTGETLQDVCGPFDVDADQLQKTLDRWNGFCASGRDDDFGYIGDLNPIDGGPYYLLKYKPAVHYTMGGLHIDTDAHVLDNDGAVIKGLYAAGEVAGHKMGTNRLGSCSMADIYTFGRIAGKNAATLA